MKLPTSVNGVVGLLAMSTTSRLTTIKITSVGATTTARVNPRPLVEPRRIEEYKAEVSEEEGCAKVMEIVEVSSA